MSKRLRDIAIGCRGKHRYPAMPDARRAADELGRRKVQRPGKVGGGRASAYHCLECQGFHIGRRKEDRQGRPRVADSPAMRAQGETS